MATKQKKKQKPFKDIYYRGKTYTEEGFKRLLLKEGKIRSAQVTIYYADKIDLEYGCYYDFSDMVEEMRDKNMIEDTDQHFEDCQTYNNFGSTDECKYCPYKEECKRKEL